MKSVLIVEDEYRTRNGLGKLINKVDLECCVIGEAENGYEGIKMIQDLAPDIVISDIQMPKMDGLVMIQKAQEMGAFCEFVILTGYADFEYARQGLRLGVKEYLLKPVTITDVKKLLVKLAQPDQGQEAARLEAYSPMVQDMIVTMEAHYGMRLGLDSFGEKYHLTPEYISNLFARETGTTFSNYLKKIRLEKAKELILGTDMKIYQVACLVGYPDQKYFSKVFKEYTGVSAKQFAVAGRNIK